MNMIYYLVPKMTYVIKHTDGSSITIDSENIYTSESLLHGKYVIDNLPKKPSLPSHLFFELPYYDIENADNMIQKLLK